MKNYHEKTVEEFQELLAAIGLNVHNDITLQHIYRRVSHTEVKTYEEIYNYRHEKK